MNLLFEEAEIYSESPRKKWIKKHGIHTHYALHMGDEDPWIAWNNANDPDGNGIPDDPETCGYGDTEDEAITHLAMREGLKLWNEEDYFQNSPVMRTEGTAECRVLNDG